MVQTFPVHPAAGVIVTDVIVQFVLWQLLSHPKPCPLLLAKSHSSPACNIPSPQPVSHALVTLLHVPPQFCNTQLNACETVQLPAPLHA